MAERDASQGVASGDSTPVAVGVDVGPLRNGLGALENLKLLLESIKVGQKGLFAAVSAVHADCAPMIASTVAVQNVLALRGVDVDATRRLCDALAANLRSLDSELSRTVASGRVSVAERLKLEGQIARAARELGAALPLASLLDHASQPGPLELTPVELLHDASADASERDAVGVHVTGSASAAGVGVPVDLEAGKLLVAVGVALVVQGQSVPEASMSFSTSPDGATVTTIERRRASGRFVRITAPRVVEPTLLCARAALARLGGTLEYSATEHRVRIYWPPL